MSRGFGREVTVNGQITVAVEFDKESTKTPIFIDHTAMIEDIGYR